MKKQLLIITLFFAFFCANCSQPKSNFPDLTKVAIDEPGNVFFAYDKETTRFINTSCSMLAADDPFFCNEDEMFEEQLVVAKFKNKLLNDSVVITYSSGPSADPVFVVSTAEGKAIKSFYCLEFYLNSSATIYTSGHTNNMYDRRRKYQLQSDTIVEIGQQYNYVGLEGRSLKEITLYNEMEGTEIIAQLPVGSEIEILLADGSLADFDIDITYLVKTDFGLVGWLRLSGQDAYGEIMEELFYAGD